MAYPAVIVLSSLLSAVVLYLVRKDTRGVLDGQDVTTQYMVDNTGEVVKEEEEEGQVGQIMGLLHSETSWLLMDDNTYKGYEGKNYLLKKVKSLAGNTLSFSQFVILIIMTNCEDSLL